MRLQISCAMSTYHQKDDTQLQPDGCTYVQQLHFLKQTFLSPLTCSIPHMYRNRILSNHNNPHSHPPKPQTQTGPFITRTITQAYVPLSRLPQLHLHTHMQSIVAGPLLLNNPHQKWRQSRSTSICQQATLAKPEHLITSPMGPSIDSMGDKRHR